MAQKKYTQKQQVIDTLRKCGGYATLDNLISHIEDLQKSGDGLMANGDMGVCAQTPF